MTDRYGRFHFEDLRPGEWMLEVFEENLPVNHDLEKKVIPVTLRPGANKSKIIQVWPRKRQIRMFQDGGVLSEENNE